MERTPNWSAQRTYVARFEDGPRDASTSVILGLESGQPPDLLLTPGQPDAVYMLAGGERDDGSLPYIWMPRSKVSALHRMAERRAAKRPRAKS
jgi:hypothetical protein